MTENRMSGELEAFERHLEAYGANQAGWPETARARFASLPSREHRAQAMLAEARALDRLLDCVPSADEAATRALADRIVAAASRELPDMALAANAKGGREHVIELHSRASRKQPASARREAVWQVAALLAASLVAGVFIGTASPVSTAVQSLAQHTVLTADNSDVQNAALFEEPTSWPGSWDDEDSL